MDKEKNSLTVPIAIIVAGALIAGALFFSKGGGTTVANPTKVAPKNSEIAISAVNSSDHIVGSPDAKVIAVEYSDTECPFCKQFHVTMNQLINKYGKDGNFAWVYRHFPIVQLHSKAPKEAEATECAAELGGNAKFWEFTNKVYSTTGSNNSLDPAQLPKIAGEIGLNVAAFNTCLSSGKYTAEVQKDYDEATKVGGNGTPYTVLVSKKKFTKEFTDFISTISTQMRLPDGVFTVSKDNQRLAVSGAMPFEVMDQLVQILSK